MRPALAFLLLCALSGCAGSPRHDELPSIAGESFEPAQGTVFCYQLIVCPLISRQ
ncbi:hypothetical protein AAFN46_07735 [Pseudomonas sp. CAU 1711]|uniref:hypothetical protein n=1 Tax=Pseudomonas sp. CAU 1711 TaxID=3140356 RepID=UPI0032610AFB